MERTTTFGCFVKLLGFEKDGLVHISQLANSRVENVDDVVSQGDKLFVKVYCPSSGRVCVCAGGRGVVVVAM